MKVAVITRHAITNYGSLLQAFATQTVIERLGHECEIIDYLRDDETYTQSEKTLLNRKPSWNNNVLKKLVYLLLRQPESILAGRRFEKERTRFLNLTYRYSNLEQLREDKPLADCYMTGSDQVWGPVSDGTYDSAYCLSFTDESDKKVAYAASFGHTDMTPELEQYYKKWLTRYQHLSVRENSAVDILNRMGIAAQQVIDPTLLLDATFWNQYTKPIKHKGYILVYQIHNDKRLGEYAQKVSKAMNLPLIRISTSFHQIVREGEFVWCPSVGEFLSYIKNASCVITDSFHGTAFCINFNTQFVSVLPNNNTGTRNMSILELTGLLNQILKNEEEIGLADNIVDFSYANMVLEDCRKRCMNYLKLKIEG